MMMRVKQVSSMMSDGAKGLEAVLQEHTAIYEALREPVDEIVETAWRWMQDHPEGWGSSV